MATFCFTVAEAAGKVVTDVEIDLVRENELPYLVRTGLNSDRKEKNREIVSKPHLNLEQLSGY